MSNLSVRRGEKLATKSGAGLTAKGRAKYNREHGTNLKAPAPHPKSDKDAARRVLFGVIDGLGERGKKQWRRFFNGLMRLEPGELAESFF